MRRATMQPAGVSLREVLPEAELIGAVDVRVTACSRDWRRLRKGDLFAALVGGECDGHEFAHQALQRGAAAILASRPVHGWTGPVCYVEDTRGAYGRVCQALAGNPSRRLKTIGVTGTNGKTTVTRLIASVLQAAALAPSVSGTLGRFDGVATCPTEWTTPPAEVLAGWLRRSAAHGCTHAVMEVSSHALAQSRVAGIEFDVVCLTNIARDHLDYHGTIRNYRRAKARIFEHLAPEGFSIINVDDPPAAAMLSRAEGPVLTVGLAAPAEVTATIVERCASEQTFLLEVGSDSAPVRTPLVGDHNVGNCLIAAAVGLVYGLDVQTIVRGLEAVVCVPGRMQRIECGQPFSVFVDYAHTPDALTVCLQTLRRVTRGRLICVFGAGGDRDQTKRPLMGLAAEQAADLIVLTSDNPRSESPRAIIDGILSGCRRGAEAVVIEDRGQAIAWALGQACPGDCVLIAGKGHETSQIIADRREPFDDRQAARAWLYAHAAASQWDKVTA